MFTQRLMGMAKNKILTKNEFIIIIYKKRKVNIELPEFFSAAFIIFNKMVNILLYFCLLSLYLCLMTSLERRGQQFGFFIASRSPVLYPGPAHAVTRILPRNVNKENIISA